MKLFTKEQFEKLLANGVNRDQDHDPVVKLFTPDGAATWLINEIDPDERDLAFGLCDLGMGCPELGYVSIPELFSLRGKLGLAVERDRHFTATHPISVYARAARIAGCIVEDEKSLAQAAASALTTEEV